MHIIEWYECASILIHAPALLSLPVAELGVNGSARSSESAVPGGAANGHLSDRVNQAVLSH